MECESFEPCFCMKNLMAKNSHFLLSILSFFLLSILMLGLISPVWGQDEEEEELYELVEKYPDGYILSQTGDTTFGFIRVGNPFKDQQRILFYDNFGGKTTYQSDILSGYGYGDRHFHSQKVPVQFSDLFSSDHLFMQVLVKGPARLYRYYIRRSIFTFQKGPAFIDLIIKPSGEIFEVSYAFKWKRIAFAFEDYQMLKEDILTEQYDPDDTQRILARYNEWFIQQETAARMKESN